MLVQTRQSSAEVQLTNENNALHLPHYSDKFVSDSCQVNNGGCGSRANCTRDSTTNIIRCICRAGFVNTGSDSNVVCTGNHFLKDWIVCFSEFFHDIFQKSAECEMVGVIQMQPALLIPKRIQSDVHAELAIPIQVLAQQLCVKVKITSQRIRYLRLIDFRQLPSEKWWLRCKRRLFL